MRKSVAQAAFFIIITIDFIFYIFLFLLFFLSLFLGAFCNKRPQLC